MTYIFDLDNTLCRTDNSDYENSKPIVERIIAVNSLFEQNHKIIIYTARGMGSTGNNQLESINKFYSLTEKQLKSWSLKYHLLLFGKPSGDFYVDDKGIRDADFFESKVRP